MNMMSVWSQNRNLVMNFINCTAFILRMFENNLTSFFSTEGGSLDLVPDNGKVVTQQNWYFFLYIGKLTVLATAVV